MKGKRRFQNLFFILLIILFELWTFRNVIFGGKLVGSNEDGLLAILMTEHWYKVIGGFEHWSSWISMYPLSNSVALNDMYILHAVFYCPLRFFGLDKYVAYQAAVVIMHFLGSLSMYLFLTGSMKFKKESGLLGTVCFSFGSYYIIKILHSQFLGLCLVPVVMAAFHGFISHVKDEDRKKRNFWMLTGIVAEVMAFYTAAYVAEFILITIVVYVIVLAIMCDRKQLFQEVVTYLKKGWIEGACGVLIGVILMIPFCKVYFPWSGENVRSYGYAANFFVTVRDLFNVAPGNNVYGKLIEKMSFVFGENTIGLTPVTWLLAIAALAMIFKNGEEHIKAIAVTFLLIFLIPMRIGRFCLWGVFYRFFPGASGMRVVCRIALMALPLLAVMVAYLADKHTEMTDSRVRKRIYAVLTMILSVWLVFENGQSGGVPSAWNHDGAIQTEAQFDVAPPEGCDCFFLVDSAGTPDQASFPQYYQGFLKAWLIADKYNVPTLNGFGSYTPRKYRRVYNIYHEDYIDDVNSWIELNRLENVYSYDLTTKEWKRKY